MHRTAGLDFRPVGIFSVGEDGSQQQCWYIVRRYVPFWNGKSHFFHNFTDFWADTIICFSRVVSAHFYIDNRQMRLGARSLDGNNL